MFPCTCCGLCCQNISAINELKVFDLGNGICKYLDISLNLCKIYNDRPLVCNIDKSFQEKYNKYFNKITFYRENAKICNKLQSKSKLDKKFKINN